MLGRDGFCATKRYCRIVDRSDSHTRREGPEGSGHRARGEPDRLPAVAPAKCTNLHERPTFVRDTAGFTCPARCHRSTLTPISKSGWQYVFPASRRSIDPRTAWSVDTMRPKTRSSELGLDLRPDVTVDGFVQQPTPHPRAALRFPLPRGEGQASSAVNRRQATGRARPSPSGRGGAERVRDLRISGRTWSFAWRSTGHASLPLPG